MQPQLIILDVYSINLIVILCMFCNCVCVCVSGPGQTDYNWPCTMLLEQIKGFYHGITKMFLLVDSYTIFVKMFI